jgi:hypothetical protein
MDLGFETMGNATVVISDRGPLLVTDPWLGGDAYFGSWGLSHPLTPEQRDAVAQCRYVWVSHGHPDHLDFASIDTLRGKELLLPDHVGARIADFLRASGHTVRVLDDRTWTRLTDRVQVCCIADYNQDAVLLIDVGGRLVVDLNDAQDSGWWNFVRKTIRKYPQSFLLALSGWGDADMINFFDDAGQRIAPAALARKEHGPTVGAEIVHRVEALGATHFVPFSSMHRYQRTDSAWANACVTELDDYAVGFDSPRAQILPPYVRYDFTSDSDEATKPPPASDGLHEPGEFGDDWSEEFDDDDRALATDYFSSVTHLGAVLDFVTLRVGGRDHTITFAPRRHDRGITFEAPRRSLRTALDLEIFDDLLIGNFMKTTLHGKWGPDRLYPDFTPYVAKFADNGRAKTDDQVRAYLALYRRRAPVDYLVHRLKREARHRVRRAIDPDSRAYQMTKRLLAGRAVTRS